jgi:hypothetical protein
MSAGNSRTAALASFKWQWSKDAWEQAVARLGLVETSRINDRASYKTPEGDTLSAYFTESHLELVELTLERYDDPEVLSRDEYLKVIRDFTIKFQAVVNEVASFLAQPAFLGGPNDVGYPDDQDALRVAIWQITNARLMVALKHEDKELPIRLSVVVSPPGL